MARQRYSIESEQDKATTTAWLENQNLSIPSEENINSWCNKHLDNSQWKRLQQTIRAVRYKQQNKLINIKVTPEAHTLLSEYSKRERVTLSGAIVQAMGNVDNKRDTQTEMPEAKPNYANYANHAHQCHCGIGKGKTNRCKNVSGLKWFDTGKAIYMACTTHANDQFIPYLEIPKPDKVIGYHELPDLKGRPAQGGLLWKYLVELGYTHVESNQGIIRITQKPVQKLLALAMKLLK